MRTGRRPYRSERAPRTGANRNCIRPKIVRNRPLIAPAFALVSNQGQWSSGHTTSISFRGTVFGRRWSDLLARTATGTWGPATEATASYHWGRSYNVSARFTSQTRRTPPAFMKNASLRSSRNWWFPMMSQIATLTVTEVPGREGSSTANSFELSFVPRVEMYLSSNVFVTNRRLKEVLPTPGLPARVILRVRSACVRPRPLERGAIRRSADARAHKRFRYGITRGNGLLRAGRSRGTLSAGTRRGPPQGLPCSTAGRPTSPGGDRTPSRVPRGT